MNAISGNLVLINQNTQSIANNTQSIANNTQSIANNTSNISDLNDSLDIANTNISNNTTEINTLKSYVGTDNTNGLGLLIQNNTDDISNINSSIITLQDNIDSNTTAINTNSSAININNALIQDNITNINTNTQNISNNTTEINTLKSYVGTDETNGLGVLIQNNLENIARIDDDLSTLQQDIENTDSLLAQKENLLPASPEDGYVLAKNTDGTYYFTENMSAEINIIDNLTSFGNTTDALSANQGYILNTNKENSLGNPDNDDSVLISMQNSQRFWKKIEDITIDYGTYTGNSN